MKVLRQGRSGPIAVAAARLGTGGDGSGDNVLWDDGTWRPPSSPDLALDDLTDVNAPSPADDDVLTWDAGTSKWVAAAGGGGGGGGGGLSLPTIIQSANGSNGGGTPTVTIAQPQTTSMLIWIACHNGSVATPSLTNWTWTQLFTDNVGGVGNLAIYTGVYAGSGTPGTSITSSGGSGVSGALVIEVADKSSVSSGSGTIRAGTLTTNTKQTGKLVPQDTGSIIAFLVHTSGSAATAHPVLYGSIDVGAPFQDAAQALMFGVSVAAGWPVMGSYHPSAVPYTLAELRLS